MVVDVLDGAYDPDGAAEDLEVVDVSGDPSARVVDGVQVRADRGRAEGAALRGPRRRRDRRRLGLHPAGGDGLYVLPGSLIELDSGTA